VKLGCFITQGSLVILNSLVILLAVSHVGHTILADLFPALVNVKLSLLVHHWPLHVLVRCPFVCRPQVLVMTICCEMLGLERIADAEVYIRRNLLLAFHLISKEQI
jgi:hypothetical protein